MRIRQISELSMFFSRRNEKVTKTVNLPEVIYRDLKLISEGLTSIARKPISPAMTIALLIEVYRAYLSEPCARDAFRQKIATSDFMSPEDFERELDSIPQDENTK